MDYGRATKIRARRSCHGPFYRHHPSPYSPAACRVCRACIIMLPHIAPSITTPCDNGLLRESFHPRRVPVSLEIRPILAVIEVSAEMPMSPHSNCFCPRCLYKSPTTYTLYCTSLVQSGCTSFAHAACIYIHVRYVLRTSTYHSTRTRTCTSELARARTRSITLQVCTRRKTTHSSLRMTYNQTRRRSTRCT